MTGTTKSLADYVIKHVEQLASVQHAAQEPQYFTGRNADELRLGRAGDEFARSGCTPSLGEASS